MFRGSAQMQGLSPIATPAGFKAVDWISRAGMSRARIPPPWRIALPLCHGDVTGSSTNLALLTHAEGPVRMRAGSDGREARCLDGCDLLPVLPVGRTCLLYTSDAADDLLC